MTRVTVVIPTFRRPASFERALRSIFSQTFTDFEIVAIDNSPEGSALEVCARLAAEAPRPMRFAHESRPGVAYARNAAMRLVNTPLVAFLDDDEEAQPDWLEKLCAARAAMDAHVVWGPVRVKAPGSEDDARATFVRQLFERAGPSQDARIKDFHGIGNALMVRQDLLFGDEPFPLASNEVGGEDDFIFASAQARGLRFAWASQAWVWEHVEESRMSVSYALAKAFAFGQGPSSLAARDRNWPALARHLIIGSGQATVYGVASLCAVLFQTRQRYVLMGHAARGLGKLIWWRELRFYGQAAIDEKCGTLS
jgi:glycosyltransferase involved in cell wall biosynthesis